MPANLKPFVLFLLVGGFAAGVNIAARALWNLLVPYEIAIVLAFPIALTVAFTLDRRFVFRPSGRSVAGNYWRFTVVNLLALCQVWIVSVGLARYGFPLIGFTWHTDTIAHSIGVASPAFTSFFAHWHFSFKSKSTVT